MSLRSEKALAHVKTECNCGEGIELKAGQDAPPTVSVARFLNMNQSIKLPYSPPERSRPPL